MESSVGVDNHCEAQADAIRQTQDSHVYFQALSKCSDGAYLLYDLQGERREDQHYLLTTYHCGKPSIRTCEGQALSHR